MNNKDYLTLLGLLAISGLACIGCEEEKEEDEEKTLPPVFKDAHYFRDHSSTTLNLPRVYKCITRPYDEVPQADLDIDADLPDMPDELTVYSIIRPTVDEDYAIKVAGQLGFNGEPEEIDSSYFPLNGFRFWEGQQALIIYKDGSIAIYYVTDPGRPSSLPSDQECIDIAQEWLEDHELYPENVISISASPIILFVSKGIDVLYEFTRNISVSFTMGIDGYEVLGMGAYVAIGENGEILQVYINAPEFKKYSTVSLRRLNTALETFEDYLDYPQLFYADTPKCLIDRVSPNMSVTDISIKYFCMLSEENALPTFAQPILVLEGRAYHEDYSDSSTFTGRVDAVIR